MQGAREGRFSRGALILGRMMRTLSKTIFLLRKHLSKSLKELRSEARVYMRGSPQAKGTCPRTLL